MKRTKTNKKTMTLLAGAIIILVFAVYGAVSLFGNLVNNSIDHGVKDKTESSNSNTEIPKTQSPDSSPIVTPQPKLDISVRIDNDILSIKNALNNYSFTNVTGDNKLLIFVKYSNIEKTGFFESINSILTNEYTVSEKNGGVLIIVPVSKAFTIIEESDDTDVLLKIASQKNTRYIEYRNDLSRIYMNINEARLCSETDSFIKNYVEIYDESKNIYTILIDKKYMPKLLDEVILLNDKTLKSIEIQNRESDIRFIFTAYEKTTIYPNTRDYDAAFTFLKKFSGLEPFIVLDPGHGGIDGGTTNSDETILEKNIVLNLCTIITKQLKAKGYHILNLREEDIFLGLMERTDIANLAGADAIISIHANSYRKESVNGITTLYKNSDDLAKLIQESVVAETGANSRGIVKMLDLSILNRAEMDAVIVETGFLTNLDEGKLLNTKSYQEKIATGISDGIIKYFSSKKN